MVPEHATTFPATATVLTAEDIRLSGARQLSDVLRLVPGIEVSRNSATESNVSLRGFNDASSAAMGMQVLIDGHQVYNEFYGNAFWDALPVDLDEIVRIEVIRGPFSFLHGPNAMHGLVNIITRSPRSYPAGTNVTLAGSYGKYNSSTSRLTYVARDEERNAALQATFLWDDLDRFEPDGNDRDKQVLKLRYDKQWGEGDRAPRLDLIGLFADQRVDLLIPRYEIRPTSSFASEFQDLSLMGDLRWGDTLAKASWRGFRALGEPEDHYQTIRVDSDVVDLELQHRLLLLEGHELTLGAAWRFATFATRDPDISGGRHDTHLGSFWLQDDVTLAGDLFATVGMRADRHSTAGLALSPRAALVWVLDEEERQSLRASYGTGYRLPSLRELWFDMEVYSPVLQGPFTIGGNDQLVAEELESFELGWLMDHAAPEGSAEDSLRAGVTAYYNRIDALAEFDLVSAAPVVTAPRNAAKDRAFGVEAELDYRFAQDGGEAWYAPTSAFANYSFGERQDRVDDAVNPLAPRHKANAGLRWQRGRGSAMLWTHYFGETTLSYDRAGIDHAVVEDYILVNGSLAWRLFEAAEGAAEPGARCGPTGSAYVRAFNLLDHRHRENPLGQDYGLILTVGFELSW